MQAGELQEHTEIVHSGGSSEESVRRADLILQAHSQLSSIRVTH